MTKKEVAKLIDLHNEIYEAYERAQSMISEDGFFDLKDGLDDNTLQLWSDFVELSNLAMNGIKKVITK